MAYTKHSLTDFETVIDAQLLGEMEDGIEDAHNNLDGITVSLEGTREENGRKIESYKMTLPNGKIFDFELKDGEKGDAGNVNINDKTPLRFFAGTKADYDALPDKTNVFAIITDDRTQIGLIDTINGFLDGSIPVPTAWDAWHATTADSAESAVNSVDADGNIENIAETYVRKDEKKIFNFIGNYSNLTENGRVTLSEIPTGKTIDDIVGIGIKTQVKFDSSTFGFSYSATLQFSANKANLSGGDKCRFILSAISHDSSSSGGSLVNPVGMATMVVSLGNTTENKATITFEKCNYTLFDADQFLSAKLSDNIFKLMSIVYYFA